jgi:capsular polysaccharide biosynthesis protein
MDEHKNEIELIDILNIIWKRKWLIIIPTLLFAIIAGVISFLLPPKWEVDAIILPSKFLVQTAQGQFDEVVVVDPQQIAGQINKATYNNIIAAELNIDIEKFPKLRAENLRDTKLVRISIKEKDVEKAKSILNSLFAHLKRQLDTKVDIEMKGIDSQIKSRKIKKPRIEKEIKAYKNKLNIVKQRKTEIEKEISNVRKRIEALEKEQRLDLKRENRSEAESLAMLLYSTTIQQSLTYINTLSELLSRKKNEEEDINIEIENKKERIKQLENEIVNLNERKGRMDYAQLIKEPTSSVNHISPKKTIIILVSSILGLMIFTMLAFFVDYLQKHISKVEIK